MNGTVIFKKNSSIAFAAVLAAAFAWVLNANHYLPSIAADEIGYISISRLFAGVQPLADMSGAAYYSFGYSILLAPLNFIWPHTEGLYRAGVVLNAALLLVAAVLLKKMLDGLHGEHKLHAWLAFAACLYPSNIQNVGILWTECTFTLVYVAMAYVASKVALRPTWRNAIGLIILSSYAYAVHPRALLLPLVSLIMISGMVWRGRLRVRTLFACLIAAAALAILTRMGNAFVFHALWGPGDWNGGFASRIRSCFTLEGMRGLATAALGQLWYAGFATLGIVFCGVLRLFNTVWRRTRYIQAHSETTGPHSEPAGFALFLLLATGSVFAASVFQMMDATRADHFVYGRYIEGAFAPLLVIGLASIARANARKRAALFVGVAIWIVFLAVAAWFLMPVGKILGAVQFTVPALAVLHSSLQLAPWLLRGTCAVLLSCLVGLLLSGRKFRWILGFVILVFAVEGIAAANAFRLIVNGQVHRTANVRAALGSLRPLPVYVNETGLSPSLYFFFQADLPGLRVRRLRPKSNGLPHGYYLIASSSVEPPRGAYEIAAGGAIAPTLWYIGDPGEFLGPQDAPLGKNILGNTDLYLSRGLWNVEGRDAAAQRWTTSRAEIVGRLPKNACSVEIKIVRAAGDLSVYANGNLILKGAEPSRETPINVGANRLSGPYYTIGIHSNTFRPTNGDPRDLGALINDFSYQPCGTGALTNTSKGPTSAHLYRGKYLAVPMNSTQTFGKDSQVSTWLGDGWGRPEAWGVWSNGENAELVLNRKQFPDNSPVNLRFAMNVYVTPKHPSQRIEIRVDGNLVEQYRAEYPTTRIALDVPVNDKDLLSGSSRVNIDFHLLDAVSPHSLGESADVRRLGIGLVNVTLQGPPGQQR